MVENVNNMGVCCIESLPKRGKLIVDSFRASHTVNMNIQRLRFLSSKNVCLRTFGKVARHGHVSGLKAFSLVELLVVVSILVAVMALLVPAFSGIKGGGDLTKAAYDITGTLDQARAYAMSNSTYVFVGFAEVDASVDSSAKPQVATGAAPYGRVAVAVVASKDGTKHYADAVSQQGADWQANYGDSTKPEYKGAHLVAISKLQHFENLHLSGTLPVPASGAMARPVVATPYILGNADCSSQTPFTWPLGSLLAVASGYQYRFDKVIQFDPQGVARIIYGNNGDSITQWMEVALQQTHGNAVSTGSNVAAIQIDAMTGATAIYRP